MAAQKVKKVRYRRIDTSFDFRIPILTQCNHCFLLNCYKFLVVVYELQCDVCAVPVWLILQCHAYSSILRKKVFRKFRYLTKKLSYEKNVYFGLYSIVANCIAISLVELHLILMCDAEMGLNFCCTISYGVLNVNLDLYDP